MLIASMLTVLLCKTVLMLLTELYERLHGQTQINQRTMYNGYKRVHAMKFQSVVVPDGLIANLSGPYKGKRHDSNMLHQSELLPPLEQHAVDNGTPLCLYGDPAYLLGFHLQGPFKDRQLTPGMSSVSVEWMFGSIWNYFVLIHIKNNKK